MSEVKVNKISPRSGTDVTLGDSGDNFIIPSGATLTNNGSASGFGIAWQSAIKTASFTAVAGEGYWVNTTSSAITITLPASASVGDQIIFTDYARTWGTNAVTVNQNSLNYQGNTSPNPEYNTSGQSVNIVYSGATQGWIPNSDDDVTFETPQAYTADFLVIAGGGSGGTGANEPNARSGGGGGAGGYRNSYSTESSGGGGSSETSLTFNQGTVYTITVGAGGAGVAGPFVAGENGNDSSISGSDITTITSSGGGGGAKRNNAGLDGGSGGGGGAINGSTTSGGSGTANQGFGGGTGTTNAGGGGGSASEVGENGSTDGSEYGGDGGNGLASSITGSSVTRGAGGGGGGTYAGQGGTGGGGDGGAVNANGTDATANTGSGGGGCGANNPTSTNSGAGGSGILILRMPTANYSGTTTGSPTVGTDGTDTILTFTGSGTYTG
jgi:hypothetical protein